LSLSILQISQQPETVRLPDAPSHLPLESAADMEHDDDVIEQKAERQRQREDDLRVAMAA
jgi:hypothetical protein